ncbi:hypothetical protein [Albibacillus kandeliae]|uniref:hypothetical protein n=1 Tax=Albibacillus kandeliae TaxID=2174228 RepID=UPI000D687CA7|nr:hypothetical protein [Albibacillus kandeliae]
MDKLKSIVELTEMLRQMERDVGLDNLTQAERDVFLAAHRLTERPGDIVQSDQIRRHDLVCSIAQASYHRALRSLLALGLLERAGGARTKLYVVRSDRIGR